MLNNYELIDLAKESLKNYNESPSNAMVNQITLCVKPYIDYIGNSVIDIWLDEFKNTSLYTPFLKNIISLEKENYGEYLKPIEPTLKLEDIIIGKRLQFHGDMNRVRKIIGIDGEFVFIETLGCSEDLSYYKCHYSYLKTNETQLEKLK